MTQAREWNLYLPSTWAHEIGLVEVSLFGTRPVNRPGRYAVLLDGKQASLAFCYSEDPGDLIYEDATLSWSWSANLRNTLIVSEKTGVVVNRRWDSPGTTQKFSVPRSPAALSEKFREIERAKGSRVPDVISRMIRAFRQIRAILSPYTIDQTVSVQVFNALLVGTEKLRIGTLDEARWRRTVTVGEALEIAEMGAANHPTVARALLANTLDMFVNPDPDTGCILELELLIRHASGLLYQEAHLDIERNPQLYLPGFTPEVATKPAARERRSLHTSRARESTR